MTRHLRRAALALTVSVSLLLPASGQEAPGDDESEPPMSMEELAAPPPAGPVAIQASRLEGAPAEGKGRLTLAIAGNRRWCTFPDDRVVQAGAANRQQRGGESSRNKVYTFGYQFTIAAVARQRPAETLLLFESPVFRTAVLRPASKLGKGGPKPQAGPTIGSVSDTIEMKTKEGPATLVPWWQEQYRCTTVPEAFDFDLDPGTYDVYMAFDILLRSGSWAHRSVGFTTDVPVESGTVTRVDGKVEMLAGGRRALDLYPPAATTQPPAAARP